MDLKVMTSVSASTSVVSFAHTFIDKDRIKKTEKKKTTNAVNSTWSVARSTYGISKLAGNKTSQFWLFQR